MNKQSLEIILKKYKLPVVSVNKPKKYLTKILQYQNIMNTII